MPTTNATVASEMDAGFHVENTIPVLAVSDLQASICFYRDVLGFKLDWGGENDASHIAAVSRDDHAVTLQRREPLAPDWVWIGCSTLTPLWDKVRSRADVKVVQRPTKQPWTLEITIKDLDANIHWFGSESLEDVPFGSEPVDSRLARS